MATICIEIQTHTPGKQQTLAENSLMLHLTEGRLTAAVLIQLTVEERLRESSPPHPAVPVC